MSFKNTLITFIYALLIATGLPASGQEYAGMSVLHSGKWVRIAVAEPGIYRIDYSQLSSMGVGDPASIAIYGNNKGQLSYYNDGSASDDLKGIAFYTEKGTDGIFNAGDYILFYAEGTHRWSYDRESKSYEYLRHNYSDTAYYFITSRTGAAINLMTEAAPSQQVTNYSVSTDVTFRHEIEKNNLIKSGREWFEQVVPGTEYTIDPGIGNITTGNKLIYKARVVARSDSWSSFSLKQGAEVIKTISLPPVNMTDINGVYANIVSVTDSCIPASASPVFAVTFSNNGNLAATGYIDYLEISGRAQLVSGNKQFTISDSRTTGEGKITQFSITSQSLLRVWDVTDPFLPIAVETSYAGGKTVFKAATDTLRKFQAFTVSQALSPVILKGEITNQNLHAKGPVNMVIIAPPLFTSYANDLSELHYTADGTTSMVVTPQQIYNEFSGGIPDVAAIRNFVRMMWNKGKYTFDPLRYLLLFGDGSYENKTKPPLNPAYIPTWQSENSLVGVLSFTSDDFFGLLDDGEGEANGYIDVGIGRLPVSDTTEAGNVTRKIATYIRSEDFGSWRNLLCLVADDEDSNTHMTDAENLSETISTAAPAMTVDKIYLDAYRQVTSVSGNSYPDAEKAINDRIASGCLILNYVGHGSETGLAHERVVKTDDINSWKNRKMLPLFITATCEFSRFDDVDINTATGVISERTSAGEMVLLNPSGGGIGLMSTTRVVYSAPNFTLNNNIYNYAFGRAPDGGPMRLGDIIRLAKINSGAGMNKFNFLLLGDPALRLAWPCRGNVVTDSINHVSVALATDTVKALSLITVSGHIEDNSGNILTGFNGTVEPIVRDKISTMSTLANDGGNAMTFPVSGNIIFNGRTSVKNGYFTFSFIVPLDINYSFGEGRVTYYGWNDEMDLNGSYTDIIVGGFSDINISDSEGPEIKLFMNDTLFTEGGITDTSPTLLALLRDSSGINATGSGIGHDIIVWLDDDQSGAVTLNSLYHSDEGSHLSGSVSYQLMITEKGKHTVSMRAWDNLNNPSVSKLIFIVETDGMFRLTDLACYPNPVMEDTRFTAGHNRPDSDIKVTITIYSMTGERIRVIKESISSTGYQLPDIWWDGCNDHGERLARGMYIWRVTAETTGGEKASSSGKVIIL